MEVVDVNDDPKLAAPTALVRQSEERSALSKRALAELKQEMERGCQQMMSPDPHSTDSCSAPVFCIGCASCEEHCSCAEPFTLEELTEGKEF